ncbi:MAG: serine/threonine-protein kinase [Myxococcales bacterium]
MDPRGTIPNAALATTLTPDAAASMDIPLVGHRFSERYEPAALLGEGGMGEVRLCLDRRIDREVAVKTVRDGQGLRSDLRGRFLREARIQGQLEHPSVVPVYDLGEDDTGAAYFVMKRVRGVTLGEVLAAFRAGDLDVLRKYSRRKLLTAFGNVCLAVDFAHARGIIHRDLKPDNVMLGDFGEVYVLDWGVARAMNADPVVGGVSSSLGDLAHTQMGSMVGTAGYMAPEQVRGELQCQDARSDVYALGAILFEILTLEKLHRGASSAAVLTSTLTGADARATRRAPDREIPPELETICVRATELDADRRYRSVRALYEELERFLDGDLDTVRRRDLASEHARRAHEAAMRALSNARNTLEDRRVAMKEVGQAIAFDPTNADAKRTLVRLWTEPPTEIPPEAQEEIVAARRTGHRLGAKIAGIGYLILFLYYPIAHALGLISWRAAAALGLLWAAAAALSFIRMILPHPAGRVSYSMLLVSSLAIACTSAVAGPYVLVPSLAAMNTLAYVLSPDRSRRFATIGLGCLSVAVPSALSWVGVLPPSELAVHETVSGLPLRRLLTEGFLFGSNVALILMSALLIGRFRDGLGMVEEKLHVQAWLLRQLVPPEVQPAVSMPPPAANSLGECLAFPTMTSGGKACPTTKRV